MTLPTRVTTLLIIALSVHCGNAQVVLPDKAADRSLNDNVFGLGIAGGATTGLGLSFRHHLPSAWSYQITGGIIKVDERLQYSIGGEGQYDLVRGASNRFFACGGLGYYYSGKSGNNDMKGPARIGLGIGGEFALAVGIHSTVGLLFTYFTDGTVLPLPQLGFHYYFY